MDADYACLESKLRSLMPTGRYKAFMRSDSNYANRVWRQVTGDEALVLSGVHHEGDVRIGVSISHRQVLAGGKPAFADEGPRRTSASGTATEPGVHFAHLVAFAALEAGELDEYADAVIATSEVELAEELVRAGAILLYDDTGAVSHPGATVPVFDEGCIEIIANNREAFEDRRGSGPVPVARWLGPISDANAAEWLAIRRRKARAQAIIHMVGHLPASVSMCFPPDDTRNPYSREEGICQLLDILSFSALSLPDAPENAHHLPAPIHTDIAVPDDPDFSRNVRKAQEDFANILRIWEEAMTRHQVGFKLSSDISRWKSLETVGRALGIDAAVDAYLSGAPIEHVLA